MPPSLVEFVRLLRHAGVRVASGELLECAQALARVDLFNRQVFYLTLRMCLVKRQEDHAVFERLFTLFFYASPTATDPTPLPEKLTDELEHLQQLFAGFEEFEQEAPDTPPTPSAPAPTPPTWEEEPTTEAASGEELLRQEAHELVRQHELERWEAQDLDATTQRVLHEQGIDAPRTPKRGATRPTTPPREDYRELFEVTREALEHALVDAYGTEMLEELVTQANPHELDLGRLTEDQLASITQLMRRLAKKLSTRYRAKQRRHRHKGQVDLRTTIRRGLQVGQPTAELRYKRRRRTKPRLVVFCDVSGSVYLYVAFMLQLLLALQDLFQDVRSYVFVDHIREVTGELRKREEDVVTLVNRYVNDPTLGYASDFGEAFYELSGTDAFDRKTVLVVIADAVNYGRDPQVSCLADIAQRSRAVYWLNPLATRFWGSRECAMLSYAPHCTASYECRNLAQLEAFVQRLLRLR